MSRQSNRPINENHRTMVHTTLTSTKVYHLSTTRESNCMIYIRQTDSALPIPSHKKLKTEGYWEMQLPQVAFFYRLILSFYSALKAWEQLKWLWNEIEGKWNPSADGRYYGNKYFVVTLRHTARSLSVLKLFHSTLISVLRAHLCKEQLQL